MKRYYFIILLLLAFQQTFAQEVYVIDDFSDKYYAKIYASDTSEISSVGWIAVYGKGSEESLIYSACDGITTFSYGKGVHDGIVKLPYKEQELVYYGDFNFDGEGDFALLNGYGSCYSGPSFDIYLYDKGKYNFSNSFSELANDYCGMFQYDSGKKRIYTMTKSGCCWHQSSEFIVKDNEPFLVYILEEGMTASGCFLHIIESTWDGEKMVDEVTWKLYREWLDNIPYYSFDLDSGEKVLLLFEINDNIRFVKVDKNDVVLNIYPKDNTHFEETDFLFHQEGSAIRCIFSDQQVKYTVFEDSKRVGLVEETDEKVLNLKGKFKTKISSLKEVISKANNITLK